MPEMTIDQAIELARQELAAGRAGDAEQVFRQIVAAVPGHPGVHNGLGEALQVQQRMEEALEQFDAAVRLKPDYIRAVANRASALAHLGRHAEALAAYRMTLEQVPQFAEGHCSVGSLLSIQRQFPEAIAAFGEALRHKPEFAEAHLGLGNVLAESGRKQEAVASYREAIRCKPGLTEAWVNLGVVLESQREFEEALGCLGRALEMKPGDAHVYFQMGNVYTSMGDHGHAAEAYAQAARLNPNHADALNNLGIAMRMLGQVDKAAGAFRHAIRAKADFVQAWSNLAVVLDLKGEREEALQCHRRAVELAPEDVGSHDNLLYALHFHPQVTAEMLLEEHRAWSRRHAAPLAGQILAHTNDRNPDRPLRIGYVSPDFRDHPVGRFMLPLIAAHDPQEVEVICYADVLAMDEVAKKIHRLCQGWRDITNMDDEQVAHLVRLDQIDILVDLTMHMTGNRLRVFARKPAPVQATYLAYCSTTGLETMDYRISDGQLDPVEADCYVEKTIRVESYWCYAASAEAPAVNELPAAAGGAITFGCLNGFNKVSDGALQAWARILLAMPTARLLLHANPGSHRERTLGFLEKLGVRPERCEFVGVSKLADYFAMYHRIDVALDPFPYAGGTTTCDALWMGVPVVTLRGSRAVGRGGASILTTLGIPEWIAGDETDYMAIATRVGADLAGLARWRGTLRGRMAGSPLMDARRCARNMEGAFREMWKTWCGAARGD